MVSATFWSYRNSYFCQNRRFLELAAATSTVPAAVWLFGVSSATNLVGVCWGLHCVAFVEGAIERWLSMLNVG